MSYKEGYENKLNILITNKPLTRRKEDFEFDFWRVSHQTVNTKKVNETRELCCCWND